MSKRLETKNNVLLLLAALILAGCQTATEPLYQWEKYQPQVYEYFNGQQKGPESQIATLEEGLQKIRASGKTPPPGYHAHLGLLYGQVGKEGQLIQQFNTEKSLFPESAIYIDFLLKNHKKTEANHASK